jgi:hypothetical protein
VSGFLKKLERTSAIGIFDSMDRQLIIICLLTAGINLIGTLAYAARIAGSEPGASL